MCEETQMQKRARTIPLGKSRLLAALACAGAVLWAAAPGAAAAQTQAQILGNQHASFTTAVKAANVATLHKVWFVPTTGMVSGTPLVAGSSVYFADWSGTAWRVSSATGRVIWKHRVEKPKSWPWHGLAGTPVIVGNRLIVASVEGKVYALSASTGSHLWTHALKRSDPYAGSLSDLLAYNGLVYVGLSSVDEILATTPGFVADSCGAVIALKASNGTVVWDTPTVVPPSSGAAVWSSFALDSALHLFYCDTGNNYQGTPTSMSDALLALDAKTGALAWSQQVTANDVWLPGHAFGPDDDFGAGPQLFAATIAGQPRTLVGAGQKSGTYWVFDRATGAPVWHTQVAAGADGIRGEAAVAPGRLLCASNDRWTDGTGTQHAASTVAALSLVNGSKLWTLAPAQSLMATGAGFLSNDVYLTGDLKGLLRAYRARDGKVLWHAFTPGHAGLAASLLVSGRTLFAGISATSGGVSRLRSGLVAYRLR
jgi:polyvinyl alcohol dehydrogenase (cytochrome)